jgi:hypothetical protein
MDKKAEMRRNRLRQFRDISDQIWKVQMANLLRQETRLTALRQQESDTLECLGGNYGVESLLISRLHDLRSQRSILAAEIETQKDVARQLGRRAVSAERFYSKTFGKRS